MEILPARKLAAIPTATWITFVLDRAFFCYIRQQKLPTYPQGQATCCFWN
ncbi:MAG: hypothetical protein HC764_23465 [Pleurocapsa sp. CRU_1_2]|nr:hypothetical protein [Pleurocapsa sp. CRU_1_2]